MFALSKDLRDLLKDSPTNWGRWGTSDEIGSLNFLNSGEILRGLKAVKQGKVFALGTRISDPKGEPMSVNRSKSMRLNVRDKGTYSSGKLVSRRGGFESADDIIVMYLQGTTHLDALGHPWYDDKLWNGYDAKTTVGSLEKCSIQPIADHAIIGRAVLLDIARYKKRSALSRSDVVTLDDLLSCADAQEISIQKHDILAVRTGWLNQFYEDPSSWFGIEPYDEPGLCYEPKLLDWFHDMEIPVLVGDTMAIEKTFDPSTGILCPLHASLIRNLGIIFNELVWLEDLADDSVADGMWEFLYIASPLKIVGGTASPVNPIAIK